MASIPKLPGSVLLGRTHVQKVADKRKAELETFLRELLTLSREISEHDLLYTFFHPMLRDEADAPPPDATTFKDSALRPNVKVITGEVKMSIHYKQHALHIMIMHVKELSSETGDRPNPYVKLYLLPDPIKTSKRKTKTARATFHPTYNEMLEYRLPLQEVRLRTLQVTVWSAEMTGNEFLGALHLNLCDHNITSKEWIQWHKLSALHRIRS
ncbi:PIK3C2A [Bugula neritina]|uniref:PIK3C2A n=1 Tax=Bugula neritina TaxID=10212 RepID=A0A7J7KP67_BUGNE|nr:PIK3C2A [Bugula neritina]